MGTSNFIEIKIFSAEFVELVPVGAESQLTWAFHRMKIDKYKDNFVILQLHFIIFQIANAR